MDRNKSKKLLFERMHSIGGMPINENESITINSPEELYNFIISNTHLDEEDVTLNNNTVVIRTEKHSSHSGALDNLFNVCRANNIKMKGISDRSLDSPFEMIFSFNNITNESAPLIKEDTGGGFIINPDDKHYPQANSWMWNYCTFLGKFTDSEGNNFDLGIFRKEGRRDVSAAIVFGPNDGDYLSGPVNWGNQKSWGEDRTGEEYKETYRRAKILNLINTAPIEKPRNPNLDLSNEDAIELWKLKNEIGKLEQKKKEIMKRPQSYSEELKQQIKQKELELMNKLKQSGLG